MLGLETLKDRRDHIAEKFAIKVLKHEDHRKMFQFSESDRTRAGKKVLVPAGQGQADMREVQCLLWPE